VELFSHYPLITQAEIAHPDNAKRSRRRSRKARAPKNPGKTGRSISERAGDEFD